MHQFINPRMSSRQFLLRAKNASLKFDTSRQSSSNTSAMIVNQKNVHNATIDTVTRTAVEPNTRMSVAAACKEDDVVIVARPFVKPLPFGDGFT